MKHHCFFVALVAMMGCVSVANAQSTYSTEMERACRDLNTRLMMEGSISLGELGEAGDILLPRIIKFDANEDGEITPNEVAKVQKKLQKIKKRQGKNKKKHVRKLKSGLRATHANVKYGAHERNELDIWLADSDKPTPLVIYIHGGAFKGGGRGIWCRWNEADKFLKAGISVAMINYRYCFQGENGVMDSLHDSARAVQFLRSKAAEWNLDPDRFGAIGSSAGAGTSLYLASRDDLADPDNEDPVLRESTRLSAIGLRQTQATYNYDKWEEILGVAVDGLESYPGQEQIFYGQPKDMDRNAPEMQAVRREVDLLVWMSSDDAPMWIHCNEKGDQPKNAYDRNHHPKHVIALKKRAEEVGLDVRAYAPKIGLKPEGKKDISIIEFMKQYLKK